MLRRDVIPRPPNDGAQLPVKGHSFSQETIRQNTIRVTTSTVTSLLFDPLACRLGSLSFRSTTSNNWTRRTLLLCTRLNPHRGRSILSPSLSECIWAGSDRMGVISDSLFGVVLMMAVATTVIAPPFLRSLYASEKKRAEPST